MVVKKFVRTGYIPADQEYIAPPDGQVVGGVIFNNGVFLAYDTDGVPYLVNHADYDFATLIRGEDGGSGDIGDSISIGNVSGALNLAGYTLDSQTFLITATGDITVAPAGLPTVPGGKAGSCSLQITQDATGSRTITNDAAIISPYGIDPVLSTAAGARDLVHYYYDGVRWISFVGGQALA